MNAVKGAFRNLIALSLLSTINGAGIPANSSTLKVETNLKITVRVYNRSRFSPEILLQAQEQAASILQRAGIEASWLDCLRSTGKSSRNADCDRRLNATDIELRLVPLSRALTSALPKGACGPARPAESGSFGQFADVFSDCVENESAVLALHPALLLGHVIAHEIGHLLLGKNAHYPSGLMKIGSSEFGVGNPKM